MKDDLKTITIAAVGTGASFSLAHVNPVLSFIAAVLTIIFTALRIYDWFEARFRRDKPTNGN